MSWGCCWNLLTSYYMQSTVKGALLTLLVTLLALFFILLDILLIPRSHWRKLWDMTVNFQGLSIYRFLETCPSCMCSFPTNVCCLFRHIWLCNPMDCSSSGSSVHGILRARILEWAAMPSSRGSFWCRNWTSLCLFHWQAGFLPLAPHVKVTQSCPTLCDPMDYTVYGIFQARILE